MKVRFVVGAILILAATTAAGQIAAGIHLVDVRFHGDTQLNGVDLKKCAADLRSTEYQGVDWLDLLAERARESCLVDHGYFKALVAPSAKQLPDHHGTHQFAVDVTITAGKQFRTGDITFRNNHVFSAGELRSMIQLRSGDVFNPNKVRDGFERIRKAYASRGYPNFTAVPDTTINDSDSIISLVIDCDEAKQAP